MNTQKLCEHRGCPLPAADTFCGFHARLHAGDKTGESKMAKPLLEQSEVAAITSHKEENSATGHEPL